MALVVEDGTGLANANSYISVSDATAYHAARGNTAWSTITNDTIREQLLLRAMDYLTGTFGQYWLGVPTFANQILDWPRSTKVVSGFGSAYSITKALGVPQKLKDAQAEYALVAASTSLSPNIARGRKSVKIGPIQVAYDGNGPMATKFVSAGIKLNGLLVYQPGGSFVARTQRV